MTLKQRTLKDTVHFSGIGLHSGKEIRVEIRPAKANTGIIFQRSDLPNQPYIAALPENVIGTSLATKIGLNSQETISTIEHLMAALFGFGIDNAVVELNGAEMPIVDGSSVPFLIMIDEVGVHELDAFKNVISIKKAIEVVDEKNPERFIRIEPSKIPRISYAIDFASTAAIGKQTFSCALSGEDFCEKLAFARTFCLLEDIEKMRKFGLARGGSLKNAIVVSAKDGIINESGLRTELEFVSHKMLDLIGDLALIGKPVLGHVIAHKAGHDLHVKLAQQIALEVKKGMEVVEVVSTTSPIFAKIANALRSPLSLTDEQRLSAHKTLAST